MWRTATLDKTIYSKAQDQRPSFEVFYVVILTLLRIIADGNAFGPQHEKLIFRNKVSH